MKFIIIVALISSFIYSAQLNVENGSVTVSINGSKQRIVNNTSIHVPPAVKVELLQGPGKVTITSGKNLIAVLEMNENTSINVPMQNESSSKGFLDSLGEYLSLAIITPNEQKELGEGTKGISSSSVINFDINVSLDNEYYVLHSKALFPLPAIFTLYDKADSKIISYTFENAQLPEKSNEVFFSIPTNLLKDGQTYKIKCGSRNPKEKMQGKINTLPSDF